MEINNLEYALNYHNRGLVVLPTYSPAIIKRIAPNQFVKLKYDALKKNETTEYPLPKEDILRKVVIKFCKRAIISWTQYQKRHPTEDEIRQWFTQYPDANIAIVTGRLSNLCVFDIDSKEALEYANELGGFPDTVKATTSKGWHYYMQYPEFEVRPSTNRNLKIDIRAEGGIIIAPPSMHGSGNMYEWEDGCSFSEINPAPCSEWMKEYLIDISKKEVTSKKKKQSNEASISINTAKYSNQFVELIKNGCTEGSRNDSATRLIGHYFGKGVDAAEIWELVKNWNQYRNIPPLDESELLDVFNSIKKSEATKSNAPKGKKVEKEILIDSLLESSDQIFSEYDESYVRIPFAGNNLKKLEKAMNGGLIGGRFYILGGIPSSGKTLLINNIADNICLSGHPVLFFSFDDGKSELRFRTWARFAKESIEGFNKKVLETVAIKTICANTNVKKISALKYVVQDMITVDKWENLINQFVKKHATAPVIIIDYLRKLKTDKDSFDERLRVDNVLTLLTNLAKKHNCPIVAISELARDSYKGGQRLSMASFKESGSIEYQASWLGILSCVEEVNGEYRLMNNWEKIIEKDGNIDLIVFKAKRGTGSTGKIPLYMDKDRMTARDREPHVAAFAIPATNSIFS